LLAFRLLLPVWKQCQDSGLADTTVKLNYSGKGRSTLLAFLVRSVLPIVWAETNCCVSGHGIWGGGGGGNKGHLTYIDRRECIFVLNNPYSAHKLRKEDIVFFSHTLGDSRCILYDARSDDDRTPFLFLSLFLRNTAEEPERRRNNTDASRRAASDSK